MRRRYCRFGKHGFRPKNHAFQPAIARILRRVRADTATTSAESIGRGTSFEVAISRAGSELLQARVPLHRSYVLFDIDFKGNFLRPSGLRDHFGRAK